MSPAPNGWKNWDFDEWLIFMMVGCLFCAPMLAVSVLIVVAALGGVR